MRIAPSRGSLCGADKWLRTWEGSHSVKGAARPPIRLIAGQPDILEPLDDACGGVCCFSNYSNGQRIFSPMHTQEQAAQVRHSRPEWPLKQNKRFLRDPSRNVRVWLSKALFCRLAHRRPKVRGGVLPDPSAGRLPHRKLRHRIRRQRRAVR